MVAAMAYLGWRRGGVVSMIALGAGSLGAGVGALIASIAGNIAPIIAITVGALVGLIAVAVRHEHINDWVDEWLDEDHRPAERSLGAIINAALCLSLLWFIAAVFSLLPLSSALVRAADGSRFMGVLVASLPPTGNVGAVILRSGVMPGLNGPLVVVDAPDPATTRLPAVLAVRRSVLQIRGEACNAASFGSGWVVAPELVVTNAHVVAGVNLPLVSTGPNAAAVRSRVVAFDPQRDVAVLYVEGLQRPALRMSALTGHGQPAAIIGYPKGGDLDVEPARIDQLVSYDEPDIYGNGTQPGTTVAFRALVRPGNSGGVLVDDGGAVLGTVTARAVGQRVRAGYAIPNDVIRSTIRGIRPSGWVPTGPCLDREHVPVGRGARSENGRAE